MPPGSLCGDLSHRFPDWPQVHVEEADPDGPLFSAICGILCILAPVFPVIDAAFAFVYRRAAHLLVAL